MLENVFRKETPEVESVLGTIDTFLRWRRNNEGQREYSIYHPSAFGGCLRKMQYQRYAAENLITADNTEDLESRIIRLFEKGHNMQSRWERYFAEMQIIRGVWECSNPLCKKKYGKEELCGVFKPDKCSCGSDEFGYCEVSIEDKSLNMFGHADIILDFEKFDPDKFKGTVRSFNTNNLPKKPIVIDMKTINQKGFDALSTFNEPPSIKYIVQLIIYAFVLDCEYGILIYECKNDSKVVAYRINKDEEVWNTVKEQASKMIEMMQITGENGKPLYLLPPPRPTRKSDWECKSCEFKGRCHSSSIWKDADLKNKRSSFYGALLKDK